MRVVIPDLGHGNSVGIFDRNFSPLLIDCGTRNDDKEANFVNLIEGAVKKARSRELIITHYHFDHYNLLHRFPYKFFDSIRLPALPPQSRSAQAMLKFLALATTMRYKKYDLTPLIATRSKTIWPLVKYDSFSSIGRDWEVLWPDYTVIDKRNRKKINTIFREIARITERLSNQKRMGFEETYKTFSRVFSKEPEENIDLLFPKMPEEKESDVEVENAMRSTEKIFRDLANRASLVVRDEFSDFLFTGDIDDTILKNHLNFEQDYFLIEAPHHGGYYGRAFDNVSTDVLVISRAMRYKPRCEYFRELVWNTLVDTARMGNYTITFPIVKRKKKRIGILAYGSVIDDPGTEIERVTCDEIRGVETPFKIEFARKSRHRDYAPTLVPVERGGARVEAHILVLKDGVSEKEATDILWRRETHQIGSNKEYKRPILPNKNKVFIERLEDFQNIDIVLYTYIGDNIDPQVFELR